jgi:F0F1-type ATP synthase assembly protein I
LKAQGVHQKSEDTRTRKEKSMQKWYTNKVLLNTLILIMIVGFIGYLLPTPQIKQLGLIVFLVAGTMVMIRGVVKITMGMRKTGR